jgi:hypothetical protein
LRLSRFSGKNDAIYQIVLVPGFTAVSVSVSGAAAGFNPVIYLYDSACATASNCAQSGDANNPIAFAGVPAGTYFLAATAAPADATGGLRIDHIDYQWMVSGGTSVVRY